MNTESPDNKFPESPQNARTSEVISEPPYQEESGQVVAHRASAFSGPIPPPEILKGYNEIAPGLAERIVAMAEREADHRHGIDHKALDADISEQNKMFSEARLGQICGLIIGLAAIVAGAYTAISGAQWPGGIIGGGGVIGLVSVFIYGRKQPPNTPVPPTTSGSQEIQHSS
jgi:uncharacterized membrane protein